MYSDSFLRDPPKGAATRKGTKIATLVNRGYPEHVNANLLDALQQIAALPDGFTLDAAMAIARAAIARAAP